MSSESQWRELEVGLLKEETLRQGLSCQWSLGRSEELAGGRQVSKGRKKIEQELGRDGLRILCYSLLS